MGFIDDPDQSEDFPVDPDDYESTGYSPLDPDGRWILEIFENAEIEVSDDYLNLLLEDLVINGGLHQFGIDLESYGAFFKPPDQLQNKEMRMSPFMEVADAYAYLEGIPGWEGFAGLTWSNGSWFIWVGETQ